MGMFDYINYEMDCPECGARVSDFQSKDGPCALDTLEYWEVDYFYASCENCRAWVEFTRKTPRPSPPPVPIGEYEMAVRNREI